MTHIQLLEDEVVNQVMSQHPSVFVSNYHVQFFYFKTVLKDKTDKRSQAIYFGLETADYLMKRYERKEGSGRLTKLRREISFDYDVLFSPKKLIQSLKINEETAKKYELLVLYKQAIKGSNSTKKRRVEGAKKRSEYISSKRNGTKDRGASLHNFMVKQNISSISALVRKKELSRVTVYKRLASYYQSKLRSAKKENPTFNNQQLIDFVSSNYSINKKYLQKIIIKM